MIQPRGKVPYEFFSQLVQHSFEIYTRASRVTQTRLRCKSKDDQCRNVNFSMINPHFYSNGYWRVRSDVMQFQEANTTFFDLLYKHTKILPETISLIIQRKASPGKMSEDNQVILNKLSKCDKKAAVFPETVALQMETILLRTHRKDSVYVGKTIVFQSGYYFAFVSKQFELYFPTPSKAIIKRLNSYKAAGFEKRWESVIHTLARVRKEKRQNQTRHLVDKRMRMDGNIVVVFIVFLVGLLIGIVSMVFEKFVIHWILNPRRTWLLVKGLSTILKIYVKSVIKLLKKRLYLKEK